MYYYENKNGNLVRRTGTGQDYWESLDKEGLKKLIKTMLQDIEKREQNIKDQKGWNE